MRALLNKKLLLFSLVAYVTCLPALSVQAGDPLSDKEILYKHITAGSLEAPQNNSFMKTQNEGFFSNYNPFRLALGGLMYVYQQYISPQMPAECLYHTSCSAFSLSLIHEYGIIKGTVATADRLMRCNRVAVFDIHPLQIHEKSGRALEETNIYRRKSK